MVTAADEVPDPEGFRLAGISRVSAPGIGGWTGGSDEVPVVCWVVELGVASTNTSSTATLASSSSYAYKLVHTSADMHTSS